MPNQEGMKSLLSTINKELGENALDDRILDQVFETYWPLFEKKFNEVIRDSPASDELEPTRSSDDILTEILYTTRTLDKRIRFLEKRTSGFHVNSDFSTVALNDRIVMLVNKGLQPEEIAMELEDIAPKEYVMNVAISLYKNRKYKDVSIEKPTIK